jgi:hypothetical protein
MGLIRNKPEAAGYSLGEHLDRFFAHQITPDSAEDRRCATCAFRKGTYANGCVPTVMDALKCTMEKVPFHCHERGREGCLCFGYETLTKDSDRVVLTRPDWKFSDEYRPMT